MNRETTFVDKLYLQAFHEKYEQTRMGAFAQRSSRTRSEGFSVVVRNGLLAWTRLIADTLTVLKPIPSAPETTAQSASIINEVEQLMTHIILERLEA